MGIRKVLAINLRRLRHERGLSQEELAHRAGIDRGYVSSIERERYGASVDKLEQLAVVLDVAAFELLRPAKK